MSNKIFPIVIVLFTLSFHAFGQRTASLLGSVHVEKGESLPGITVSIKGTTKGAVTDNEGKYLIKSIEPGTYIIEISGIGFEQQSFRLSFKEGEQITREITLIESTSELDEVVVTAESEARELQLSAKSVQVIETREIKLKSTDLGEVLAQTEGVNVQRTGGLGSGARFSLNGLSGDQVRLFYDGLPLNYTLYSFGIANVPVNMIDRVEIYKGVVPIEFGADALGGAVNMVPSSVFEGFASSVSYQVGSFNTHRATANFNYADDQTGLFIVGGGFYDFTDNDYKMDVAIANEQGQLQQQTVRRFHDGYRAYGTNLQLGIRNKKWANQLSLEGYYGDYRNEIQNSQAPGLFDEPSLGINKAVAGSPFGEVVFNSFSHGVNLHYDVGGYENSGTGQGFGERWEFNLKAGYNYNERISIDTTRNLYNWLGEVVLVKNQPGEFGEADHFATISESVFARQQLSYTFSDKHALKLSVAPTYSYRTGEDLLIEGEGDPALDDEHLFDVVTGLEYTTDLLDKRFENIAFVKHYHQSVHIESFSPSVEETLIDERSVNNFGAGNGIKYDWSPRFSTKLSYEYAYRLPRPDEIFGDGLQILENLDLRPESSHNVNIQWHYVNNPTARTDWNVQGNFFLRRIDDLIFLLVGANDFGSFQNVWSATSQGVEVSGRWKDLTDGLTISANATYQRYFNSSDTGPFAAFKSDRIPNTPYFFANGAAAYELTDIIKKQDRLSVFWNVRYVNSFFVGWESAGLKQFKDEVPDQIIHALGITHRINIKNIQNALSLEIQNLTDAKVFDLFGVQRPGRAFYIKSTIQF